MGCYTIFMAHQTATEPGMENTNIAPEKANNDALIEYYDSEINRLLPVYQKLITARHDIFDMTDSALYSRDTDTSVADKLYEDEGASYNAPFLKADLRLRKGAVEFHGEDEVYNEDPNDDPELAAKKKAYRHAILEAAQEAGGYLSQNGVGVATDEFDKRIKIRDNEFLPEKPIKAQGIVIPTAAGMSNILRAHNTKRDLDAGTIVTNKIYVTTGERAVPEKERLGVEANGFRAGKNEYESSILAMEDIFGVEFGEEEVLPATYGEKTPDGRIRKGIAVIDGREVEIIVTEAKYDRMRHFDDGTPTPRASTDETFLAILPLLEKEKGTLVVESHDIWVPYQDLIAKSIFAPHGKDIVSTGPLKEDRLYTNEDGELDVRDSQGLVDELGKRIDDLVKLRVAAENSNLHPEHLLLNRLTQPIPDMDTARVKKAGYRKLPISDNPELVNEPMVGLSAYGISGQSYYSRDNKATGEALPGVPKEVMVRESLADVLQTINEQLDSPTITAFFGGEVELYAEEGFRSRHIQKHLYDTVLPELIAKNHPDLDQRARDEIRNNMIAKPSEPGQTPSPHETGAALDIVLRYKQDSPLFAAGSHVPLGFNDGDTGAIIEPDFYETRRPDIDGSDNAKLFRRAFYNIMTGRAFGGNTGLVNNPTEIFHWGYGDQLSSKVLGNKTARYGYPNELPYER